MWTDAWMQRLARHGRSIGIAWLAASITGMSGAGATGSLAGTATPGTYAADALAGVARLRPPVARPPSSASRTRVRRRIASRCGRHRASARSASTSRWSMPAAVAAACRRGLVDRGAVDDRTLQPHLGPGRRCGRRHQHPRRSLLPRRPATQARERDARHGRRRVRHRGRDVLADRRERRRGQRPRLVHGDDEERIDLRVRRHRRFAHLRRCVDHDTCLGAVARPRPGPAPVPAMRSPSLTSTRLSSARIPTGRIESHRSPTRPPRRARDRSIASISPIPLVRQATFPPATSPAIWYATHTS